jgi:hypothetical protein
VLAKIGMNMGRTFLLGSSHLLRLLLGFLFIIVGTIIIERLFLVRVLWHLEYAWYLLQRSSEEQTFHFSELKVEIKSLSCEREGDVIVTAPIWPSGIRPIFSKNNKTIDSFIVV